MMVVVVVVVVVVDVVDNMMMEMEDHKIERCFTRQGYE